MTVVRTTSHQEQPSCDESYCIELPGSELSELSTYILPHWPVILSPIEVSRLEILVKLLDPGRIAEHRVARNPGKSTQT